MAKFLDGCIFCKILHGAAPADTIYEVIKQKINDRFNFFSLKFNV